MTLPASGALSFSQIQAEFGGANPIGFSEYYKGGSFVPNIPANSQIPTSGVISVSKFYGGAGQRIAIPNNIGFAGSTDSQRYIGFVFGSDGIWRSRFGSGTPPTGTVSSGTWKLTGSVADYDIMCESGIEFLTGTGSLARNTWYNLGAGATFYYDGHSDSGFGLSGVIHIRDKVTLLELDSKSYTFNWSA